jgi:hypothetical protein
MVNSNHDHLQCDHEDHNWCWLEYDYSNTNNKFPHNFVRLHGSTLLFYLTLHSWLGQKGCLEFHDDDCGEIITHGQIFVISSSTQTKQKNGGLVQFWAKLGHQLITHVSPRLGLSWERTIFPIIYSLAHVLMGNCIGATIFFAAPKLAPKSRQFDTSHNFRVHN